MERIYERTRQEHAAKLYDRAARLIEARRDFLYLAHGDTPRIRALHEAANQIANHLTCAYGILEATEGLHMSVEEHMETDPEICKSALAAIAIGIRRFRIRKSWVMH